MSWDNCCRQKILWYHQIWGKKNLKRFYPYVFSRFQITIWKQSKYISILNVIQGNVDAFQVLLESFEYFLSDISIVVFICLFILTLCNFYQKSSFWKKLAYTFHFLGSQGSTKNSGEETDKFYWLGSREYPGFHIFT